MSQKIIIEDIQKYFYEQYYKYLNLFNKVKNEKICLRIVDFIISINNVVIGEYGCHHCYVTTPDITLYGNIYSQFTDFEPYECEFHIHGNDMMCKCDYTNGAYNKIEYDEPPCLFFKTLTIIHGKYFFNYYLTGENEKLIDKNNFKENVDDIKLSLKFEDLCSQQKSEKVKEMITGKLIDPSYGDNLALRHFYHSDNDSNGNNNDNSTIDSKNIELVIFLLSHKKVIKKIIEYSETLNYSDYCLTIAKNQELTLQLFENEEWAKKILPPEIYHNAKTYINTIKSVCSSYLPIDLVKYMLMSYIVKFHYD